MGTLTVPDTLTVTVQEYPKEDETRERTFHLKKCDKGTIGKYQAYVTEAPGPLRPECSLKIQEGIHYEFKIRHLETEREECFTHLAPFRTVNSIINDGKKQWFPDCFSDYRRPEITICGSCSPNRELPESNTAAHRRAIKQAM